MLRVPTVILAKLSALITLNLEIQLLCNLDAPLNEEFCISGFAFLDLLKIDYESVKLPCS